MEISRERGTTWNKNLKGVGSDRKKASMGNMDIFWNYTILVAATTKASNPIKFKMAVTVNDIPGTKPVDIVIPDLVPLDLSSDKVERFDFFKISRLG